MRLLCLEQRIQLETCASLFLPRKNVYGRALRKYTNEIEKRTKRTEKRTIKEEKKRETQEMKIRRRKRKRTNVCVPRRITFLIQHSVSLYIYIYTCMYVSLSLSIFLFLLGNIEHRKKDGRNNYKIRNE